MLVTELRNTTDVRIFLFINKKIIYQYFGHFSVMGLLMGKMRYFQTQKHGNDIQEYSYISNKREVFEIINLNTVTN